MGGLGFADTLNPSWAIGSQSPPSTAEPSAYTNYRFMLRYL